MSGLEVVVPNGCGAGADGAVQVDIPADAGQAQLKHFVHVHELGIDQQLRDRTPGRRLDGLNIRIGEKRAPLHGVGRGDAAAQHLLDRTPDSGFPQSGGEAELAGLSPGNSAGHPPQHSGGNAGRPVRPGASRYPPCWGGLPCTPTSTPIGRDRTRPSRPRAAFRGKSSKKGDKKSPKTEVFEDFWSCWPDLNLRSHPYQHKFEIFANCFIDLSSCALCFACFPPLFAHAGSARSAAAYGWLCGQTVAGRASSQQTERPFPERLA